MKKTNFTEWYNQNYKTLFLIPAILFILSFSYMFYFYSVHDDFIYKDISLTGGTTMTIQGSFNVEEIKPFLEQNLEEVNLREISDLVTQEKKALIIQTKSEPELTKLIIEEYLGYELNEQNSSLEFSGSTLSQGFYKQLLLSVFFAFIFMAIVVFLLFRSFVPSLAVIISAFADILMTLTLVNILGIKISSAGIVAFLMLIGYSVDTDILLTTRLLKRKGEGALNHRIYNSFKTGITMTLTSLLAVVSALFIVKSFSVVLSQIFIVLSIGLCFDILNTWITNVAILRFYLEKQGGEND